MSWRYARGLLDRVEIRALEVLDEGELELVAVARAGGRPPGSARGRRAGPPGSAARRRRAGSRRGSRSRGSAGGRRARGCWRPALSSSACVEALARLVRVRAGSGRAGSRLGAGALGCALRDERREAAAEAAGSVGARRSRSRHCDGPRRARLGASASRRELVRRAAGGRPRRRVEFGSVERRSAGRSSAPRRGGRCAGRPSSNTASPRWRPDLGGDLGRQVRPGVVHRQHDALDGELGVQVVAHEVRPWRCSWVRPSRA